MKNTLLFSFFIILTISGKAQTVTDADGNIYNTVTIGSQVWMKENLKTTKYNDGSNIPFVTNNDAWPNATNGAYTWYYNDEAKYKQLTGHYTTGTRLRMANYVLPVGTSHLTKNGQR